MPKCLKENFAKTKEHLLQFLQTLPTLLTIASKVIKSLWKPFYQFLQHFMVIRFCFYSFMDVKAIIIFAFMELSCNDLDQLQIITLAKHFLL